MERLTTSEASVNFSEVLKLVDEDTVVLLTTHNKLRAVVLPKDIFQDIKKIIDAYYVTNEEVLEPKDKRMVRKVLKAIID